MLIIKEIDDSVIRLEELKETSKKRVFSKVDVNKSAVKRTRIMINQYLKGVEE